mmetsp:Transcript_25938/g.39175  ORF Transcript_25938/g.39175 Transcript_25938/m.39175 type:complete len:103 (-) Transcript_25938:3106-3414(-)
MEVIAASVLNSLEKMILSFTGNERKTKNISNGQLSIDGLQSLRQNSRRRRCCCCYFFLAISFFSFMRQLIWRLKRYSLGQNFACVLWFLCPNTNLSHVIFMK